LRPGNLTPLDPSSNAATPRPRLQLDAVLILYSRAHIPLGVAHCHRRHRRVATTNFTPGKTSPPPPDHIVPPYIRAPFRSFSPYILYSRVCLPNYYIILLCIYTSLLRVFSMVSADEFNSASCLRYFPNIIYTYILFIHNTVVHDTPLQKTTVPCERRDPRRARGRGWMMDKSKSRKPCWRLMWTSCEKRVASRVASAPEQYLFGRGGHHNFSSAGCNIRIILCNLKYLPFMDRYFRIRCEISNKYEIYVILLLLFFFGILIL